MPHYCVVTQQPCHNTIVCTSGETTLSITLSYLRKNVEIFLRTQCEPLVHVDGPIELPAFQMIMSPIPLETTLSATLPGLLESVGVLLSVQCDPLVPVDGPLELPAHQSMVGPDEAPQSAQPQHLAAWQTPFGIDPHPQVQLTAQYTGATESDRTDASPPPRPRQNGPTSVHLPHG